MKKQDAKKVIENLSEGFDSHDFIMKYIDLYEQEYLVELFRYAVTSQGGVFRNFHSRIGEFLSKNEEELGIEKVERKPSLNVKGKKTENQRWRKVSSK